MGRVYSRSQALWAVLSTGEDIMDLVLPWPGVTTNSLYRRVAHGQVALSPKAVAYRDEVIVRVRQAIQWGATVPKGDLELWLWLFAPDHRRYDADNLCKLVQDSLFAGLGTDDSEVIALHVLKAGTDHAEARIGVRLGDLNTSALSWGYDIGQWPLVKL